MIDPKDITIESWSPPQKGGQHTGRISCGIKITHIYGRTDGRRDTSWRNHPRDVNRRGVLKDV